MKKGWKIKKLGDVCTFVRGPFGGSLKKNIFKQDGYAVYEQQHAIYDQFSDIRYFIDESKFNEMKRFELHSGDLIMSCSGTMGKIAIVPKDFKKGIINQALLKLSPSREISNIFLKLYMQSEVFQDELKKYSQGAAIQNVASVAILKKIAIPLPEISEQKEIVSILDKAFADIEKAKVNAERNLKNAKDLFESYLQSVFSDNGKGWEEKTLEDVCEDLFAGGDVPKNNSSKTKTDAFKIPIFANGEKNKGLYGYTNISRVTKPSITISARGTIGYSEIRREPFFPVVRLIVVVPKTNIVELCFLKYVIGSMKFLHSGSSIPQLTVPMVKNYPIYIPSLSEQAKIVKKLDDLSTETKKLEKIYESKIKDLEELKKSILQKAFNGELKNVKV